MYMKKFACLILLLAVNSAYAGVRADLRQGGKLYENKKYGQALSKYNEILQENPKNEDASFGAGAAAYYLKDYQAAEKSFEQTVQQQGEREQDALFNLGNAYYRAGNVKEAEKAYRQAIVKNPKDKEAVHNLQLLLQQQQNQQNQNNQNQQNQDPDSSNQNQQNQASQGASEDQQDQPSPADLQDQMDKADADRVMQMARENEYKKPTRPGAAQGSNVEKDW